jgi:hypothetical protein
MIIATVAVAAIALFTGAFKWQRGGSSGFDPETRTRLIIASELTRLGVRGFEITKVHCVEDTSTRYECDVASRIAGVEGTLRGTLACDGTDPSDYCVWRGELTPHPASTSAAAGVVRAHEYLVRAVRDFGGGEPAIHVRHALHSVCRDVAHPVPDSNGVNSPVPL